MHAHRAKGQKRPADVIGNAVRVMRIATGEEADDAQDDGKSAAAKELGSKGGKKCATAVAPKLGKRGPYKKSVAEISN
ncbi:MULTISPECIES: RNA-binding protein [unclassified Mesorhizobium]|uniref:RNA-binding protein n=1 Tax=unclassified Mesorhizobium TaxID=325217 RepID=UPI000FC9B55F|nr:MULTISPECIES: RNA-binding protein [unclassified Mesorhizobium]TIT76605.1 MAG: RNA-binding protein [Mesorhizobium sp.]TGP22850.1 RNA-binding protein [Mesorhizobium sp. M1D.F.Ca.ET.231.01.1.1]TGP31249.1 RNA-binding protein [Mesorhizobium sp. M1D.F.Ca.ET.234.01.1.1]TGS45550.1 RNA-binding protein [Mesorhizobium sp. M1D.F.Ca.ET.184.01.1.1]TGS61026.1 RNA-binding protein [Mesorhizobium sp. M1D.F.Ca.ET.183.01.1.1]